MLLHGAAVGTSAFPEFHQGLNKCVCRSQSCTWLWNQVVNLGRKPKEKIRSLIPLAKTHQPAVEVRHPVVSSGTSPCLTFFLALPQGSILSWKGPAVTCDEAICPASDHTDPHLESQDRGTPGGEPAGFAQQMNSDRVRLRWDSSHLLLQV